MPEVSRGLRHVGYRRCRDEVSSHHLVHSWPVGYRRWRVGFDTSDTGGVVTRCHHITWCIVGASDTGGVTRDTSDTGGVVMRCCHITWCRVGASYTGGVTWGVTRRIPEVS